MAFVKELLSEIDSNNIAFVEHERRRTDRLLKNKGFSQTSYNKNKVGEWTHSTYEHPELPHEVRLSHAKHPNTGESYLNIRYTKKYHTNVGSPEDLEDLLKPKVSVVRQPKHWWSRD